VLPACGSSDKGKPIPTAQANQMIALVRLADQQSSAGTCNGAQDKVRRAQAVLENDVPKSVDRKVRQGLAESLDRLNSLIQSECQRPQKTQTETTPTDTTQTQTQTTQTETTTTPTTTTPTTTTPTTTTPTTTTPTTTTPTTTGTDTGAGNGGAPSAGGNGGAQG
jgi:carbohydrate-binding DOMON domain-containing protein